MIHLKNAKYHLLGWRWGKGGKNLSVDGPSVMSITINGANFRQTRQTIQTIPVQLKTLKIAVK